MTWLELNKHFTITHEMTCEKVSKREIKELTELGEDYLLKIVTPMGEIFRISNNGTVWGIYLLLGKLGDNKRTFLNDLKKMGLSAKLTTDDESTWSFSEDKLLSVASKMKAKKK